MSLPRLNRRLSLQAPEIVPDGAGGFSQTWQTLGTLWGEVTPRTGREVAINGAPVSAVSYKITVRGAPADSRRRPQPQHRLRDGARIFKVRAVTERDPNGFYLTCYADEEVIA
ncbi:MAG: head-tail adaptor protein [Paracoccaceae bacterium]